MSETQKIKIIREVLQRYTGRVEEFEFVKAALSRMTLEELEQYAAIKNGIVAAAEADDRLLELEAARAADRAWHEYEMSQAREPQRQAEAKAQLERDRRVFEDAAKILRTFGVTEANFNVVRQALGSSFSVSQIQQLLTANPKILSGPTQKELNDWERERIEQHNQMLRNADPVTLRSIVRSEAEQRRAQAHREEQERQIAHREMLDAQVGYPTLPEFNSSGEKIDAAYLTRISNTNLDLFKRLIRMHGAANVTARLRGIR